MMQEMVQLNGLTSQITSTPTLVSSFRTSSSVRIPPRNCAIPTCCWCCTLCSVSTVACCRRCSSDPPLAPPVSTSLYGTPWPQRNRSLLRRGSAALEVTSTRTKAWSVDWWRRQRVQRTFSWSPLGLQVSRVTSLPVDIATVFYRQRREERCSRLTARTRGYNSSIQFIYNIYGYHYRHINVMDDGNGLLSNHCGVLCLVGPTSQPILVFDIFLTSWELYFVWSKLSASVCCLLVVGVCV